MTYIFFHYVTEYVCLRFPLQGNTLAVLACLFSRPMLTALRSSSICLVCPMLRIVQREYDLVSLMRTNATDQQTILILFVIMLYDEILI